MRFLFALSLVALNGCTSRDNPLDVSHPFDRAIYGYALDDAAVVRRAAAEIERLVGSTRTSDAFERAMLAQRAICGAEGRGVLRCFYRKRSRILRQFLGFPTATYYQLEFILRSSPSRTLALTVCYGSTHWMGAPDETPEHRAPDRPHCANFLIAPGFSQ